MGKGSNDNNNKTTTSSSLPAFVQPYFDRLLQRTETESNKPYQPYQGQRQAQFNPDTTGSFNQIRNMQEPAAIQQGANIAGGVANYSPTYQGANFNGGIFDSAAAQQYMSPYTQNVLDVTKGRATQAFNEQQGARNAAAVHAGAFGGSRAAIQNGIAQRGLNEQMQAMDAQGMDAAYNNAAQRFQSDQARRLQAGQLTDQSAQQAQSFGLQGQQLNMGAASLLGGFGQAQQQLGMQRSGALASIGGQQQAQQQAGLDIGYQDFLNQRDYPRNQLQFYNSMLNGVPVSASGETTTTTPAPNQLNSMMGMGLSALSLYNMYGGGGGSSGSTDTGSKW